MIRASGNCASMKRFTTGFITPIGTSANAETSEIGKQIVNIAQTWFNLNPGVENNPALCLVYGIIVKLGLNFALARVNRVESNPCKWFECSQ